MRKFECTKNLTGGSGGPEDLRGKFLGGFTLAEVLIALVIIGVVAAMTIPSLLTKLDKVVKSNQIKVFERKIEQGMDNMNLAGEIGPYYDTTEKFVQKLSEHMKIVTICDKDNLTNCFPYEEIQVKDELKPVKVKDIENGRNFGLDVGNFKDVAGIVLADGTPMILSWNVNCPVSDADSSTRKGSIIGGETPVSATACVKGIYDLNGPKGPNLFNKDVVGYGGITNLNNGAIKIAGLKITKFLKYGDYQPLQYSDLCDENAVQAANSSVSLKIANTKLASDLGIEYCYEYGDYWAGAMKECGGVTKVANVDQVARIANELYAKDGKFDAGVTNSNDLWRRIGSNGYTYQPDSEAAKILASVGLYLDSQQTEFYIGTSSIETRYNSQYCIRFERSSAENRVTSRIASHLTFMCLE